MCGVACTCVYCLLYGIADFAGFTFTDAWVTGNTVSVLMKCHAEWEECVAVISDTNFRRTNQQVWPMRA